MMVWLWLVGCAAHTVDVSVDPGQGTVDEVTAILETRMSAIGARKYKVEPAEDSVTITLLPEDQPRLDAILQSPRLSIGWEGDEPFSEDVAPKLLQCLDTPNGVMWRIKFESYEADMMRIQTELHGAGTLVFRVDGESITEPYVPEPITGGTAMAPLEMSYRDCRVLSAQILGGPLPEGVGLR